MSLCALCGKQFEPDKYFSRKSACPHCKGDLHICLNCRFYSPQSHNKCSEPKAEFQRSRDRANFCDYFRFGEGGAKTPLKGEAAEARKKFDDLFRK